MKRSQYSRKAGFTLIEVAIAMGVTAFCLIAIYGLLTVGLTSNYASMEETGANGILSEIASDLRATPPCTTVPLAPVSSTQFSISIPPNPVTSSTSISLYFDGNGESSVSLLPTSTYLATTTFLPNGADTKTATFAKVQVSWPATLPLISAVGSVQTFVALDRN